MLPEDEEEIEFESELNEHLPPISGEEEAAGRMLIMGLLSAIKNEQRRSAQYFTLIPLAFTVGLLLGYYISFINL